MAVPLGVLGAIYLNEYGAPGLVAPHPAILSDVMTGVPSIVMGLFIYTIWRAAHSALDASPARSRSACLMLPIVIRTTEEMLRLVPADLREASVALGAARPHDRAHRAAGRGARHRQRRAARRRPRRGRDRAAAVHDRLDVHAPTPQLFDGANTALSVQIFRNAAQPFPAAQERAWAAALTLIGIVFIFTVLARSDHRALSRRSTAS